MSIQSTDFFQRQDDARRNTTRLIVLFGLAIMGLSAGTYIALAMIFGYSGANVKLVDPFLAVVSLVGTAAFILLGSAYKTSALSKGGSAVAESLGAVEVDASSPDPLRRRLVNVVEEMSLASGVPVPRIYVLENEPGINAFAAGYTINDAAVAVTQGCLQQLTRDELQGVIAHEFSHVLNGDMRLNIRLIGVIHGILLMFFTGRILVRTLGMGRGRSSSSRGGGGVAALAIGGLVLMIFGYAGVLCGRLIKSAVSRQREYLADAAAVQFTRNPAGLAGALKKIGGYTHGSKITAANAEEISHMCFGNVKDGGFSSLSSKMMATHPKLEERIRRIDPSFDGNYVKLEAGSNAAVAGNIAGVSAMAAGGGGGAQPASSGGGGAMSQGTAVAMASAATTRGGNDWSTDDRTLEYTVNADDVLQSVGEASPERLVYCATLLDEIPRPLMEARSNILGAIASVYTLLLDEDLEERRKQGQLLHKYCDPGVVDESRKLWPAVATLEQEFRLPLMDLLYPTLRRMTDDQFHNFSSMVDRLIMADGKVVLKEFIIQKVLMHRLELSLSEPKRKVVQFSAYAAVVGDMQFLLSCLADVGHDDINDAAASFDAGRDRIPAKYGQQIRFLPTDEWTFSQVGVALDRLATASPTIKKTVVDACAYCVMGDGVVTVEEIELLRAICESVDIPLPPFIPEATRRKAA